MRAKKKLISGFFLLLLLGIGIAGYSVYWLKNYYVQPLNFTEPKTIIVSKGYTIGQIANELKATGVIDHAIVFKVLAKYTKQTNPRFGEYNFAPGLSVQQILEKLEHGFTVIRKIPVAEGKTVYDVMEILKSSEGLKHELNDAEIPKEGTLLPETYYYHWGDIDRNVIAKMQAAQKEAVAPLWETRKAGLPVATLDEAIILASIVEKETGYGDERGTVASVFINRLNKGMKLESDPTAVYGITKGVPLGRKPSAADVDNASEYNTYKIPALPPTPICNPGLEAIKAVLNPPESPYFYFVANGKGGHNFAVTYQEHLDNIKILRESLNNSGN